MQKDFDQLKAQALAQFLGIDLDEAERYIDDEKYLVLTDSEADDLWDAEAWKRDARFDGRGHCLAHYDGDENEETVDGETFYIYRQY